jgi:hypothetical protein
MRKQLFLLSFVAGLMISPTKAAEKEPTALGKQMEVINDAFKAFRHETDPVKGASQAREAQHAALKSAAEVPDLITQMPEGPEKLKALLEYHKMIGKLYLTLCEVEGAFLNGKIDEVAKIVSALKEAKKAGHDKFIKKEAE